MPDRQITPRWWAPAMNGKSAAYAAAWKHCLGLCVFVPKQVCCKLSTPADGVPYAQSSYSLPPSLAPTSAAVSPCASTQTSGTAVGQLVQHGCLSGQHTQQREAPACLPELQQQAGQHRLLEAHLIAVNPLLNQEQHEQAGDTSNVPAADSLPGSAVDARLATQHKHVSTLTGSHSNSNSRTKGCSQGRQPNSWMNPELQLYLHELEQSQWTASAAAAACAETVHNSPSSSSLQCMQEHQQQLVQHVRDSLHAAADAEHEQQLPPAAAAVLAWIAGVHALAADSMQDSSAQAHGVAPAQHAVGQHSSTQDTRSTHGARANPAQQELWAPGPGRTVHPNIQPILHTCPITSSRTSSSKFQRAGPDHACADASGSSSCVCVLTDYIPTDAVALLRYSPAVLGGDWHLRFLLHQLLNALADLHARGFAMGGFGLEQLRFPCPGWVQLLAKPSSALLPAGAESCQQQQQQLVQPQGQSMQSAPPAPPRPQQQQQQQLAEPQQQRQQRAWGQGAMVVSEPFYILPQLTEMWRRRVISNFEYLMWVNAAAGRRWGDRKRHPFVPWVLDLSRRPLLDASGRVVSGGLPSALGIC